MAESNTSPTHRPNIIYVFADRLRYDALSCNGNSIVRTPNNDSLARDGMVFDQAFSATPICSPYRAQILTGNYAHTNGVMCNEYRLFDNQVTLPGVLRENGYRTAYVGKWHLGYGPYYEHKRYGFDDMYAYNYTHDYYNVSYWHNEDGPFPLVEYAPRSETDIAVRYIKQYAKQDQPVCLFLSWGPPHWNGLSKPRRYGDYPQEYNLYKPEDIEVPPNVPSPLADYARRGLADYYGMVSSLDDSMGALLRGVEESGLGDDTIVCFSSDHGDFLGAHGCLTPVDAWLSQERRLSKASPYTEACKVPFIVRWPEKVPAHVRTNSMFNSVDVMPTLLSLVGVESPEMQGTDLSHVFRGREGAEPESVYLQILGPGWPERSGNEVLWRGVRTERYIYARWKFPSNRRLLIDVYADPYEMRNLAGDPGYRETLDEMESMLGDWIERTSDPFDTGARLPVTDMLDIGQAFITDSWYEKAPTAYAEAIRPYLSRFATGEQKGDPIRATAGL